MWATMSSRRLQMGRTTPPATVAAAALLAGVRLVEQHHHSERVQGRGVHACGLLPRRPQAAAGPHLAGDSY
jgi:hypothetical protein